MPRRALSESEVINLVSEAQTQLDEYLRLAELSMTGVAANPLKPPHSFMWENPLGLVIGDTDVNGFVVRAAK